MDREQIFKEIENIEAPDKDFSKILPSLHYTHFFLMDQYRKILVDYDLTSPQSNVIGIIGHYGDTPVSLEQIKHMVLEPNADVSRIVARLVEKKFVQKVVNEKNRRKVSIMLTARGEKIYKRMLADRQFMKFTENVSMQEAKVFMRVLAKLRQE
jgi:DNA-binding MarR family transcriptional regulator